MYYIHWQERLQVYLTLAVFGITVVTLIFNLFLLVYWLHSELNEDLPTTPRFSLHSYTNVILLIFCLGSISLKIKMYWMIYREVYNKSTFTWVGQVQVFVVISYLIFSVIFTVLYANFPMYSLASPFHSYVRLSNVTKQNEFNIPTWLDRFQSTYQCCGIDSYMDYNKYTGDEFYGPNNVPKSCCKNTKENWINNGENKACITDAFSMIPTSVHLLINTQGCDKRLERVIEVLTLAVMWFNWTITVLNVLGIVAFYMQFEKKKILQLEENRTLGISDELESHLNLPQSSSHISASRLKSNKSISHTDKSHQPYNIHTNISALFNNSDDEDCMPNNNSLLRHHRKEKYHQFTNKNSKHSSYDHFSRHGLMNVP